MTTEEIIDQLDKAISQLEGGFAVAAAVRLGELRGRLWIGPAALATDERSVDDVLELLSERYADNEAVREWVERAQKAREHVPGRFP